MKPRWWTPKKFFEVLNTGVTYNIKFLFNFILKNILNLYFFLLQKKQEILLERKVDKMDFSVYEQPGTSKANNHHQLNVDMRSLRINSSRASPIPFKTNANLSKSKSGHTIRDLKL